MDTQSLSSQSGVSSTSAKTVEAQTKRYHPALVALHWLIAILIFSTVLLVQENEGGEGRFEGSRGNFPQQGIQQSNPPQQDFDADEAPQAFPQRGFSQEEGAGALSNTGIHMLIGFTILALLVIRLLIRWTTKHPAWQSAGNQFFDWVGVLTHWGLYLLTFGMVITGIILADTRGILARTFGFGSTPTPGGFGRGGFNLGFLHGGIWTLLLLLIIVHIGAALYHQFILKDNLFGRMWFGKRTE